MKVLSRLATFENSWVDALAGTMEDAAVVHPESGPPLIFTVDFITPIVDDAETFGAIAAANSISDVYAMGGEPRVALAICGFPDDRVPPEVLERILRGGRDKAAEAGCAIVGGHTVIDPELKYGLCVLGVADPERILSHQGARPGDLLVLTKPVGTGIAAQALKSQTLEAADLVTLTSVMTTLNRGAKDAALAVGVRTATDVTGFGLLGHLHHLLLASNVAARVDAARVPTFDFARALADGGTVPGGTRRNLEYVAPHTGFATGVSEVDRLLLCDAQTSGGLLLAVPPEGRDALLSGLEKAGTPARSVIGEVVDGPAGRISVVIGADPRARVGRNP